MQTEIVIAGFGGQGILFAGQILARAAMALGRNVTWLPSYGPEMRGGTANVTVIISDEEIGSPLTPQPQAVLVFNLPSLQKYEPLVKPGGVLVVNSSLIDQPVQRTDITVAPVPANDIALQLGSDKAANMVMLGALVAATDVLPLESVAEALREYLAAHGHAALSADEAALRRGAELLQRVR
ncbi:MAG: Pyruvate synthase subunit PorC [Anaerolineae bacterium]|nr:Pyruvate synthase subunit PorC [Anaerolineae bacterium]